MSRMTRYLKQTCMVEAYKVDGQGKPVQNRFGELEYMPPVQVKCRHEISNRDIKTDNGSVVRSTARYFFDTSVVIKADYRVDGDVVLIADGYVNGNGKLEGYEVWVSGKWLRD